MTPDRTKPITARRLGDSFDREAVLATLETNAKQAALANIPSNPAQAIYEEYGFASAEELNAAREAANSKVYELNKHCRILDTAIGDKKTLQKHVINYCDTLPIINAYYDLKPRKQQAYHDEHRRSFVLHDAAKAYFDAHGMEKELPSVKKLQAEIDDLVSERNDVLTAYRGKQQQANELNAIYSDVHKALHKSAQEKRKEQDAR